MAPKVYICSKEKELGTMAADISNIKTDMTEMKKDSKEILACIHSLKEELPQTYATKIDVKEELKLLRKEMNEADKAQDRKRSKATEILINNLPWLITALALLIYNILKSRGLI